MLFRSAGHGEREKASQKESEWANGRMGEWTQSPFRQFSDLPIHYNLLFRRQRLDPAQIGVGFGYLSDAALALLAFA